MEFVTADIGSRRPVQRGHGLDRFWRARPYTAPPKQSPYGNRLELASLLYEGRHNRNDGDVTMPELSFAGLGGKVPGVRDGTGPGRNLPGCPMGDAMPSIYEQLPGMGRNVPSLGQDIITMARETLESAKPAIDFFGAHPWLTLTLVVSAIVAGGAAGGYIGAGVRNR